MIRDNISFNAINVTLLDGTEYLGKDMTVSGVISEDSRYIQFFNEENSLRVIPMNLIKHIDFYFEDRK